MDVCRRIGSRDVLVLSLHCLMVYELELFCCFWHGGCVGGRVRDDHVGGICAHEFHAVLKTQTHLGSWHVRSSYVCYNVQRALSYNEITLIILLELSL